MATEGFKVIPIKFSATSTVSHELLIKEHSVRNESEDKPAERTLFVLNVPPYATEKSFKRVFSCVGAVNKVIFQAKPSAKKVESEGPLFGFKVAYVVYDKASSVQRALNLKKLEPLSTDIHPVVTGIQKWTKDYNSRICDQAKLEKKVNEFMREYDARVEKQKQKEKQKDDGGWTVVNKKGRSPGMSRKESVKNKILEKTKKGDKRKQLTDFYTFQIRQSKADHLVTMRKKWAEDKKKVEAMKQARKFRPF